MNFVANGKRDYIWPSHDAGKCKNVLRFKRDDIHTEVFGIIKPHLLTPARIARMQKTLEAELRQREAAEKAAAKTVNHGEEVARLDAAMAQVKEWACRPPP